MRGLSELAGNSLDPRIEKDCKDSTSFKIAVVHVLVTTSYNSDSDRQEMDNFSNPYRSMVRSYYHIIRYVQGMEISMVE